MNKFMIRTQSLYYNFPWFPVELLNLFHICIEGFSFPSLDNHKLFFRTFDPHQFSANSKNILSKLVSSVTSDRNDKEAWK